MSLFSTRVLLALAMGFSAILLLSNIIAQKLIQVSIFTLPASILLYPLIYSLGSIITELYGKKIGVAVTITAALLNLFMAFIFYCTISLPSSSLYHGQMALREVLSNTPRIVFASIFSFFAGELINVVLTAALKQNFPFSLSLRTCICNLIGLSVDCLIFCSIAFSGLGLREIFEIAGSYYFFKVGYQLILVIVVRYTVPWFYRLQ